MSTSTLTLTDFLLARIAEDDYSARDGSGWWSARILADCEAKRRIVEHHAPYAGGAGRPTLELLALPYADHPDYREEWRAVSGPQSIEYQRGYCAGYADGRDQAGEDMEATAPAVTRS